MEHEHCEDEAPTQHIVQPTEHRPLSSYCMHSGYRSRKPNPYGCHMVEYGAIPTKESILQLRQEQMIKMAKMMSCIHQIHDMEKGLVMLSETKVLSCLKGICYSLFVTMHAKMMIKILLDSSGEQNPVMCATKKFPSSNVIQLCGIWVIINAMYWSELAEHIVADLECIQVIMTAIKGFPSEEFL